MSGSPRPAYSSMDIPAAEIHPGSLQSIPVDYRWLSEAGYRWWNGFCPEKRGDWWDNAFFFASTMVQRWQIIAFL